MPEPTYRSVLEEAQKRREGRATPLERATQTSDPLEAAIRADIERERTDFLIQAPPPDSVARTVKASRALELPTVEVQGREDEVERAWSIKRFLGVIGGSSAMTRTFERNPRAAAMAVDDVEALERTAKAFDNPLSRGVERLGESLKSGWSGSSSMLWDFMATTSEIASIATYPADAMRTIIGQAFGDETDYTDTSEQRTKQWRDYARQLKKHGEDTYAAAPSTGSATADEIIGGTRSIPLTIAAAATRNPTAGASLLGGLTGNQAMQEGRAQGLSINEAARYGLAEGAIEAGTELLPMGTLVDMITKRMPFGKAFMREMAQEMAGEQVATFLQDANAYVMLPENRDKTLQDFLDSRPEAAYSTALATLGGVTGTTVAIRSAQKTTDVASRVVGRVQEARRARAEAKAIEELGEAADASKLRQRDPEAYRELMREMAKANGADTVYISGEAVREFRQSDMYDPQLDPFQGQEWDDAISSGGDVAVPLEDALTDLAGTPAWDAVKDHVRFAPGGMTARDADNFDDAMDGVIEEMAREMDATDRSEQAKRTVREQMVDRLAGEFGSGYAPGAARTYAEIAVRMAEARAAAYGVDLTGRELDDLSVRMVLPEGVAEAVKSDEIDLVINAMRKGADPEIGVGPSLIEFIRDRGGINDPGGDLASMGLSSRLIREFNPDQGALGGISGAGDYGIDSVMRAAIEAGFFPDLAAVGNNELDTQRMLDAIGQELSGSPVYAETKVDPYRDAGAQLREVLSEAGLDPDGMSDAEIRAALESMEAQEGGRGFEQSLPDTIEIDGVSRSTVNSEGQPLAATEEGVRAFWKWFGDSKVVDADGRPLVVYHGGQLRENEDKDAAFEKGITFFSPDREFAENYAGPVGNVTEAYVRSEKPFLPSEHANAEWLQEFIDYWREEDGWIDRNSGEDLSDYEVRQLIEEVRLYGFSDGNMGRERWDDFLAYAADHHDGFMGYDPTDGADIVVAFGRENIKSVNNRGTFDGNDARILYQSGETLDSIQEAAQAEGIEANLTVRPGELEINMLKSSKQGEGAGTAYMERLAAWADEMGMRLVLTPEKIGNTSVARLKNFYKRFGFVENKGRKKDFSTRAGMIREPKQSRSFDQSAFHGSPHIFDRFSLDKIGTGEGAQAYGWGLYFSGLKEIAQHYRDVLSKDDDNYALSDGTVWSPDSLQHLNLRVQARKNGTDIDKTLRLANILKDGASETMREMIDADIATLEGIKESGGLTGASGRLYEVEIPEDDEYLLWDKPLSEQPEVVRKAFEGRLGRDGDRIVDLSTSAAIERGDMDSGRDLYYGVAARKQGERNASLALKELGIAGIKYPAGQLSANTPEGGYNYVVFDDSRVSIRAYEQQARGRIIFDEAQRTIELFKDRNLSTAIHELGHLFVEQLSIDAAMPDAPQQLKDDYDTLRAWWKANGITVNIGEPIPTEAHELTARGFERYFMEGKAPSSALQRIFETVSQWMLNIYKAVKNLNAPITPEVREVFDRALATREEIEAARELSALNMFFKEAIEGMEPGDFEAYQALVETARKDAAGEATQKAMRIIRRREEKKYRKVRKEIRDEETQRIDGEPLFLAQSLMKESRISSEWLEDEFGADVFDLLPRRVPPLWEDGGVDPAIVAERAGYSGARDMIEALIGAERRHRQAKEGGDKRSMRARAIDTATEAEFSRRYGDPFADGSIETEALAAAHNEAQGDVMAEELRILGRSTGQRATPYRAAREWARRKIRSGVIAEEAMPSAIQRYQRNASKAGRAAEAAMIAQDRDEAFRQKQFQMLNSALLAEAKQAQDDVDAARKRLEKITKAQTRKSVDQDYLEQAHALLEAVDLKKRSQKGITRLEQWEAWAEDRAAEGHDVVAPPSFAARIGKTNWSRLSVDDLMMLDEQVKQIMHLGRLKQTLLDNKERRDRDAVVAEVQANGDKIGRKPPRGSFTDPGFWEQAKNKVAALDAGLLKMEQVFDWLDAGDANGPFNRLVFRPIADAQAKARRMTEEYFGKLRDAASKVDKKTLQSWADQVTLDLIDPETGLPAVFQRKKLVAMALNWGNAGNRQRLADGYGWNEAAIKRALDENLTESEWAYVQEVWDIIDGLWPEIEAMERAINGVAPEKVEATEVVTPFGTLRGGYYPAIYDTTLDYDAEAREGRKSDLFGASYVKASTRASATKARAEVVKRPILLDTGVIVRHVGEVIHDISHREAVMNANSFLSDKRVMRTVDETLGREIRKQFQPWLNYIANSWAHDRAGNEGWLKFFGKLRANTTVVGMGWRFTTMFTQIAGYSNSFEYVGAKWVTPEIAKFAAQMAPKTARFVTFQGIQMPEMMAFAMEHSKELPERLDTLDRDIRREMDRLAGRGLQNDVVEGLTAAKRFAFHGIGYMDRMVSVPTWTAAYKKAVSQGMEHEAAVYAADKAIRLSQGAGSPKDLAAIARGTGKAGEILKFLTMFYTYLSTVYNRQRTLGRDMKRMSARDLPNLMARAWWLMVVPPLLAEVLSGRGPEEDEEAGWWAFKKMLSQAVGAVPIVRDAFEPTWDGIAGRRAFDYRMSPAQGAAQSVVNVGKDIGRAADGKEVKKPVRNAVELIGYTTGITTGQMATTAQFLVDVGNGEADPDGFGEWYRGVTKGRLED